MKYSLKELRAKNDWTQEETAVKLNVSTQTYNAWENDFGKVKARNAKRVADLFNVKIDDIFFTELLEKKSSKIKIA
nr:helix-turn-helix transcriptional regulator [uncultured Aminipila sp.]